MTFSYDSDLCSQRSLFTGHLFRESSLQAQAVNILPLDSHAIFSSFQQVHLSCFWLVFLRACVLSDSQSYRSVFSKHFNDIQGNIWQITAFVLGEHLSYISISSYASERRSCTFFRLLRLIEKYILVSIPIHSIKKYLLCQLFCCTKEDKSETTDSWPRGRE